MSAERRYRLLLRSYPRGYRAQRAEEMLDVLLATEDRRGTWSGVSEAVSLVRHGIALRLHRPAAGLSIPASTALAGVALLLMLAVLGAQQLTASGLRGLGLDGYPEAWGTHDLWADPRWPVQALWVVTGLALLLGRHRTAVAAAWAAAALHSWHLVVVSATTVDLPWPGNVGDSHWVATGGAAQAGWVLLTVAGAVMLGGPASAARARSTLPGRRWWRVPAAGLVGLALTSVAAASAYSLFGIGQVRLVEGVRGPVLPLVLAAAALTTVLLRAAHGRSALVTLGLLGTVPIAARWSDPLGVIGGGVALVVAGYALGSRARRPEPSTPGAP